MPPAEASLVGRVNAWMVPAGLKSSDDSDLTSRLGAQPAKPPSSSQTLPDPVGRQFCADFNWMRCLFPEEATRTVGLYDRGGAGAPRCTPI